MENIANYVHVDDSTFVPLPITQQITNAYWSNKTPREQVCDEIMLKMAEAIESDDLKQAKKLAKLAKAIKEL